MPCPKKHQNSKLNRVPYFKNHFPRYKEIKNHLHRLSYVHRNYVRVTSIGKSYEGRDIVMIMISKFKNRRHRDIVFVDATIHAREWIANSSALYLIDYLLHNKYILNMMDFYIVPCLNPDGYEYTHTTERLWRKNKNPNDSSAIASQGVDLNRNFPFGYGYKGSSSNPKDFDYRGEYPLSEPESRALALVLNKYKCDIKLYVSLHSYGNVILHPWGFTKEPADDEKDLAHCGEVARLAILAVCRKRKFRVGSTAKKMYFASGGSADYAKGAVGIKFAYTVELQHFGNSGFTPAPKCIVQIGHETTMGILAMATFVYDFYKKKQRRKRKKYSNCSEVSSYDD